MSNGRTHSTLLGTVLLLVTASSLPPHSPTSISAIDRTPSKFLPQDLCTCCAPFCSDFPSPMCGLFLIIQTSISLWGYAWTTLRALFLTK